MSDDGDETRDKFEFTQELGQFLDGPSFRWDSFATLTFRQQRRRGALCDYDTIREFLGRTLGAGVSAHSAVFTERGSCYGRWHLHALIEHPGIYSSEIERLWEREHGFAKVKKYDYKYGAGEYLALYASKGLDDLADWTVYTTFGSGAVDNLFTVATRRTGYQIYSDWVRSIRGKGPERGG